jgi:hypothetical protein
MKVLVIELLRSVDPIADLEKNQSLSLVVVANRCR